MIYRKSLALLMFCSFLKTVFNMAGDQLFIVCLVAFGVAELLKQLPMWFTVMKLAGGAYLIYLGIKSLRSARRSNITLPVLEGKGQSKSSRKLFTQAFLVSASNPKTLIFLSAFLPQFLDLQHSYVGQFAIMYLSICTIVTAIHLGYAYLISRLGQKFLMKNFEQKLSKVTGGLFITMGGGVLLSSRS